MQDKLQNAAGKLRWSLVPWGALKAVVRVLELGAERYGDHNWKTVPNRREVYTDAFLRHSTEFAEGTWEDPDSGLPHLAHAACNALFLLWMNEHE